MLAVGCRFTPTDEELVSFYLRKFLAGEDNGLGPLSHIISVVDVYSTEPWLLPLNDGSLPYLKKNEGYFFAQRKKISKTNANGKRTIRTLHAHDETDMAGGFWRMSTAEKPIKDHNNGATVGYSTSLCFYQYANKQRQRKEAVKTDWLMDEYKLAGGDMFQEWVLCRIKFHGKSLANTNNLYDHGKECQAATLVDTGINGVQEPSTIQYSQSFEYQAATSVDTGINGVQEPSTIQYSQSFECQAATLADTGINGVQEPSTIQYSQSFTNDYGGEELSSMDMMMGTITEKNQSKIIPDMDELLSSEACADLTKSNDLQLQEIDDDFFKFDGPYSEFL